MHSMTYYFQMIAADIIGAFEEAGFEDHESVAQVGKRLDACAMNITQ